MVAAAAVAVVSVDRGFVGCCVLVDTAGLWTPASSTKEAKQVLAFLICHRIQGLVRAIVMIAEPDRTRMIFHSVKAGAAAHLRTTRHAPSDIRLLSDIFLTRPRAELSG